MISVIIPTYNSDKYICEAIESVLSQSYLNYEIIVVDDGSYDDTKSIIRDRYPLVRYYFTDNKGVSSARNYGISMARGEYIAFLDSDDRWLPTKLEKQRSSFQKNPKLGMVFTENSFFNNVGVIQERMNKRKRLMSGDIVRNIFLNSYVATPTVMVRKSIFDKVGWFEEGLLIAEDDNMWMRIGMEYCVELIDEPLVQCRITEGSLSRKSHNIFSGIREHIGVIKKKYPSMYRRLGKSAIRKKYSALFFSEAYYSFSQDKYREARGNFIKSYFYCPFKLKPLLYLISTFLPIWMIDKIRYLKRNL